MKTSFAGFLIKGKNRGKLHHIIILAEGVGKPFELEENDREKRLA